MIELKHDQLVISFPEVHAGASCSVDFQRTLRLPDDNREHYLPPGLGRFPLKHIDDYAAKVPGSWKAHGGIFLPMYQAEALWLNFHSDYPFAVKVAAGKVNAITGGTWTNTLSLHPQDYLVIPDQPWLDGFCVSKGQIRQFVAMPLGDGYTAEEQLTGQAVHGGLQVLLIPMKREYFERLSRATLRNDLAVNYSMPPPRSMGMGLAPGGLMRQEIFEDRYGLGAWETGAMSRCFVHILNSTQYLVVTGDVPPTTPPTAKQYTDAGLPWFEYYAADLTALEGAVKLAGLDSVAVTGIKKGQSPLPENELVGGEKVKVLQSKKPMLRDGIW